MYISQFSRIDRPPSGTTGTWTRYCTWDAAEAGHADVVGQLGAAARFPLGACRQWRVRRVFAVIARRDRNGAIPPVRGVADRARSGDLVATRAVVIPETGECAGGDHRPLCPECGARLDYCWYGGECGRHPG